MKKQKNEAHSGRRKSAVLGLKSNKGDIKVGDYFIETHKSRSGALRDVYNYMKHIGVDAEYIE